MKTTKTTHSSHKEGKVEKRAIDNKKKQKQKQKRVIQQSAKHGTEHYHPLNKQTKLSIKPTQVASFPICGLVCRPSIFIILKS